MPGLHPTDEPAAARVPSGAEDLIRSRKDSTRMTTNLLIVDLSKISLIATLFVVKCGVPLLELAKWCCSYGLFISKSSHGIEKRGKCVVIIYRRLKCLLLYKVDLVSAFNSSIDTDF